MAARGVQAGNVLPNNAGGGGGYGNPRRDPQLVVKDFRNEFVGVEAWL